MHLCTKKSYITARSEVQDDDKFHLVVCLENPTHQKDIMPLWQAAQTGKFKKVDLVEAKNHGVRLVSFSYRRLHRPGGSNS